jgi:hypothetical protein
MTTSRTAPNGGMTRPWKPERLSLTMNPATCDLIELLFCAMR